MDFPAAEAPKVSVVVVLTADADRARRCLETVSAAVHPCPCELIVVLNGAPADVREVVAQTRGLRVVDARVDLGIPAAWREALRIARAPRVALLHEDSFPRPGWLVPLGAALDDHPHAGIVGSRLLFPDGRHQNDGWVLWRDGHVSVLRGESAQADGAAPRPVDYASSAALLADRGMLATLDLPDERWFPAVFTDTDLSRSAWAAGRTVLHVPGSVVEHGKHAMVQRDGPPTRGPRLPEFLYERNLVRFQEKWAEELAGRPERPSEVFPDAVAPDALATALESTAERAAAIARGPVLEPPPELRPPGPAHVVVDPDVVALAERRRARTDAEFTAWLAGRLEQALGDVERLSAARDAERQAAETHIAALQREIERAVAANAQLHARLAG